ncbi:MAG: DUF1501 domain-containing protein, partial [Planctomycetaceae bacterium]|nr:DUF1501 domain-containing protein [Planctomycetaceae bacterium]
PGMEICELLPQLATVADRFSIVRSITDMNNEHTNSQSDSGWSQRSLDSIGGRPGVGSVMSKLLGPAQTTPHGTAPTFVDLSRRSNPGFLGQMHAAYQPDGIGRANLELNRALTAERLDDRRSLLGQLDKLRAEADTSGMMTAMDSFTERAVGIVTSGHLAKALDTKHEDPRLVERYGTDRRYSGQNFLVARRLVEAGVRCVSLGFGGWDTHGNNFTTMRSMLPPLDRGLRMLIEDLDSRGMLDDTIIMMSGEFGRTPRINGNAGRDHWPAAAFFFVAGGGLRHGQVIGSTTPNGERPLDRPVQLQNVFSTVYRQLGIDIDGTTLIDPNGRPQYLLDHREPLAELI